MPSAYTLVTTQSGRLRAGIKWDPLERDDIGEYHEIGHAFEARKRLQANAKRIKLLGLLSLFFRATFVLRSVGDSADNERQGLLNEQRALNRYLEHERLTSFDLDLCCFCYGQDGALVGFALPDYTEMHGEALFHPAFLHSGDDTTGTGDAFDEELLVNLQGLDETVRQIFFVVVSNHHGFDKVKGGFWSIIDTRTEKEILSSTLTSAERHRGHIMARLTREGEVWTVHKIADYCELDTSGQESIQHRIDSMLRTRCLGVTVKP